MSDDITDRRAQQEAKRRSEIDRRIMARAEHLTSLDSDDLKPRPWRKATDEEREWRRCNKCRKRPVLFVHEHTAEARCAEHPPEERKP